VHVFRCDAVNFKLRKSHKKSDKKIEWIIISGEKSSKRIESEIQVKDVMDDRPQVKPLFNEKESQNEYKGSAEPNKESVEKIIDNDINTSVNVMSL